MSGSTNRSASTGRHRRPGRRARLGAPATTPHTSDAAGAAGSDRSGDGPARPLRAAGAGVGLAVAGVVLSALAPAAASAAPGLTPQQEERLRTAEREYRADVNGDDDLTRAEKECMREASWARVRAMETPARTAEKRAQQDAACRISVSLPPAGVTADPLPPSFPMPGDEDSMFKGGLQLMKERDLVLADKLADQAIINQYEISGRPLPLLNFEPDVDPSNPFKSPSAFG
jgi:hypothetical protein